MDASLSPTDICRLLATTERVRVVAALTLGAATTEEVAASVGMSRRDVTTALARLTSGGLVEREPGGRLRLCAEAIQAAAQAAAEAPASVDHGAADPAEAAVLRAFMPSGHLVSLPAAGPKRRVVLDHLARAFNPGVHYSERAVNATLRALCEPPPGTGTTPGTPPPDHVTVRRLLVDEGFLTRAAGAYWRSGGTVEV